MEELNEYTSRATEPRGTETSETILNSVGEDNLITNENDDLSALSDEEENLFADLIGGLSDSEENLITNEVREDVPADEYFDNDSISNDSVLNDLAYLDRELTDEEKNLIASDKKAEQKLSKKEAEDRLFNSLLETLPGDFGWKKDLPSDEALDAMIKNGDILDKEGDKLVGDFPSERRDKLKKKLLNGDTLYIYKEGEKYPRQLTYDADSKKFEVSEPIEKLELEKVPKPHWFTRFYLNLFSLMYRGRSLDAVRNWEEYEEQKQALAKAKSKKQIERRKRRDPSLKEKEKEKEKEKKKTEEKVKDKTEEKVKDKTEEVKTQTEEVKDKTEEEVIRNAGPQRTTEIRRAGPQYTNTIEVINPPQFEGENVEKPDQQPVGEQHQPEEKDNEVPNQVNENPKDEIPQEPAADVRGPVVNPQQPEDKESDVDAVVQDSVSQQRNKELQEEREKQNGPVEENKVPEEEEKRKEESEAKDKEERRQPENEKSNGEERKEENVSECDKLIQQLREQQKDRDTSAVEKNIRTLYENAENAKKQLNLNCEKGEMFKGGDSIAQLVAYNNVKNQIEGNGLSYTARQILSSANGPKMMCNWAMCAGEVKFAAKTGFKPSFFQDNFLNQDQLDAITERADKSMESFLETKCGDSLNRLLEKLSEPNLGQQSIHNPRSRSNSKQPLQQQQAGLGGP